MLIIHLENGRSFGWHVGTPMRIRHSEKVLEVQADGHELTRILCNMDMLPRHGSNRVQRWFGDHAMFIVHNIDAKRIDPDEEKEKEEERNFIQSLPKE